MRVVPSSPHFSLAWELDYLRAELAVIAKVVSVYSKEELAHKDQQKRMGISVLNA